MTPACDLRDVSPGPLTGPVAAIRRTTLLLSTAGVHATQHTVPTLLLDECVPLEVVSAILGHSGLAITADTYEKVTADSKRRSLAKLNAVLSGR